MSNNFYVYAYFRPDTGEPCYIGKGRGKRWLNHLKDSSNPRLRNIIAKAGGDIPHVKIRQGLSEAQAFEVEIALIAAIGRGKNGPLVNMTDGGQGQSGRVMSAEARERIRLAHLGKTLTAEHRAKISIAGRGRILSETARKNMSAAAIGKAKSISHRAKLSMASTGRTHSMPLESRARMSEARRGIPRPAEVVAKVAAKLKGRITWMRGKTHSAESRAKISLSKRGRTISEEHKAKLAEASRGRVVSEATRAKLRAGRLGKRMSDEARAKISAAARKQFSDPAARMRARERTKAQFSDPAAREKMAASKRGVPWSAERKEASAKKRAKSSATTIYSKLSLQEAN